MGHKVHPTGIRLGISKDWNSKWYAGKKHFADYLIADIKVREMLRKKLAQAGISKILIERPANNARVTIHTARPGVVIGKRGEDIEKLRKEVSTLMGVPGAHQRHRSPQARARRAAGRRVDRAAARAPHHVPPRDEARRRQRDAPGRAGHQGQRRRPPQRRRDRAFGVVPRRSRAAAHAARRRRLRLRRSEDHLRNHRHQGVGLQGRDLRFLPGRPGKAGRHAAQRPQRARRPCRVRARRDRDREARE